MATGRLRDDGALRAGLARWAGAEVVDLARPQVGWSNETLLVTVARAGGPERLVVRLPPLAPAYPEYDLHAQAAVHRTLGAGGVPVPRIVAVEHDETFLGAPFLVMEHVFGRTAGEAPGLDPWITGAPKGAQRAMQDEFVELLAQVHAVDWRGHGLEALLRCGLRAELAYWRRYVEWTSADPPHLLLQILDWCEQHAPTGQLDGVLLWGDARLGNVMYGADRRVVAALDWELATIGPPEMDLAWYAALDELTVKATRAPVPGFRDRDDLLARYERRAGRRLGDFQWHEVFALTRSVAVNDKLARLASATGVPFPGSFGDDNPMLRHIARRIDRLGRG